MDERKIDAPRQIRTSPELQPAADSRSLSLNGNELRIDQPHLPASAGSASPPLNSRASSQLLLEAARLIEQHEQKEVELGNLQGLLEQRLADADAERQQYRTWRAAEEAALEAQKQKLKSDEAEVARRLANAQTLLAQFDTARSAIQEERAELERIRGSMRQELLNELQIDRQAIDADRQNVEQEFQRARELTASLEDQLRKTTTEAGQLVQVERERLWQALIIEWEDRRLAFQQEHDAWLATVQAEKVEIEREKTFYEAAVRNAEFDFATAKHVQEAQLQLLRDEQIAALEQEKNQALRLIQIEKEQWATELASQQAALRLEREQQELILRELSEKHITESQEERVRLQAERDEGMKIRSAQLAEIQGERAVLENRIRFQQEHLEKLRADLDRTQNEHRRERQVERQRMEDDSRQIIRRMRQIDLYRSSIDEREKSLERERDVLEKTRRAFTSNADQDRLNLQREQSAWQAERQIQQSELLRQQELYGTHAESLESRRIRLEKLRTELEDTHRSTLEMRLAVEEAWVELTQAAGQEAARQRVEQVRSTLVGYYRQLHDGLVEQRREHLESQTKFERLRAEFHDERQKLMEWISTRDQELRVGEERLRLAADDAASRDSAWQVARDRWMQEKSEAEQVIRKLLGELGNQHREPAMALPASLSVSLSETGGSPSNSLLRID